jgi:hypothetical protein
MVAKYRSNEIKPVVFPNIIDTICRKYNYAYVLIETNDLGQQVADAMQFECEYDNMLMCTQKGRSGQILGGGFSGRGSSLGLRMTKAAKRVGCSNLKSLIEGDKLLVQDFDTIAELSTFISRGKSWEAEDGCNDDLVMCLVIFSWLANQAYFKELTDNDMRNALFAEQQNALEQDMAPFGFMDDGINDHEPEVDEYGDIWSPVDVVR